MQLHHGSKPRDQSTLLDSPAPTMTWVDLRPSLQSQQVRIKLLLLLGSFDYRFFTISLLPSNTRFFMDVNVVNVVNDDFLRRFLWTITRIALGWCCFETIAASCIWYINFPGHLFSGRLVERFWMLDTHFRSCVLSVFVLSPNNPVCRSMMPFTFRSFTDFAALGDSDHTS